MNTPDDDLSHAEIGRRLHELATGMRAGFDGVDTKFANLDSKLDRYVLAAVFDAHRTGLEARVARLESGGWRAASIGLSAVSILGTVVLGIIAIFAK